MKFWDILKSANGNLLRNKSRTILTILAIFIGAFTIIMTTGINTGVNNYIDKQMASAGMKDYMDVMPGADSSMVSTGGLGGMNSAPAEYNPEKSASEIDFFSQKDIDEIAQIDGVKSARGFSSLSAEYVRADSADAKKYNFENIQELPAESYNLDFAAGKVVDNDSADFQIDLQEKYLSVLGFSDAEDAIGKNIKIGVMQQISASATPEIKEIDAKIVGVTNTGVISMGRNYVNSAARNAIYDEMMAGLPENLKNRYPFAGIVLQWENPTDEQFAQVKSELKNLDATGMTTKDEVGMIKTFFDAITMVLTIFGVIALVAASIGIINTLFMAVQERTREIGLMKAMGLSRGKIFAMFSFEAIALGFWGGAVGICLAYLAKFATNSIAHATFLKDLPGFTLVEFNALNLVIIVAIIMLIAFLAGTLPARRAAKKDPIDALRYE